MNINHHNYEEYFILYLDNELSGEHRRQVELFMEENPDLKQEFEWLCQTRLKPDNSVVFELKEQLLRNSDLPVEADNYEEWLLLYIDDELSPEQKSRADELININPAILAELELLQRTKLQPDPQVFFAFKESLYRREEKVRVISFHWRRIAVAAVLLITLGMSVFIALTNNKENEGRDLAESTSQNNSPVASDAKNAPQDREQVAGTGPATSAETPEALLTEDPLTKGNTESNAVKKNTNFPVKDKEPVIAGPGLQEKETNHLPQPLHNPHVNPSAESVTTLATVEMPRKKDLTNFNEERIIATVTPDEVPPLDNIRTTEYRETVGPVDADQPGKKNRLRGFFRKVTRTIEKRTNIKATDDEDRLLLAGFAVKL
jgi:hypothetical protein